MSMITSFAVGFFVVGRTTTEVDTGHFIARPTVGAWITHTAVYFYKSRGSLVKCHQ